MNHHEEWESEDRLAAAANLPAFDAAKREELLAATARVVRARRVSRIAIQAAAVILAFVSGMLTMNQFQGTATVPAESTVAATPPSGSESVQPVTDDTPIFADPEALARAYDAADSQERLRLLRGAGDYELNTHRDVRSALAFYEQWVHLADKTERTQYNDEDTWLLASLKHGD